MAPSGTGSDASAMAGLGLASPPDALRQLAEAAARAGGRLLRQRRQSGSGAGDIRGRDIKLVEDRLSEAAIVEVLRSASPYPVLAEEGGWIPAGQPDATTPYWAIDPLDGSFNYYRGIPLCCTSVALCVGMTVRLGAVFDFNRDEMFFGSRDVGLLINGASVARPATGPQIVATGFPVCGAHGKRALQGLAALENEWRKVRMLGSAALSLAWLAAGRLDGYQEQGIMWWDVAAGLALVESAGGLVSVEGGGPDGPLDVRARAVAIPGPQKE